MLDLTLFDQAIILTGPTGSGKSSLACALVERYGGEILSMDSMSLYRGMDIGTAKPLPNDLARIPHHLIDCFDPWQGASVSWWLSEAHRITSEILHRGKRPWIIGGTPLYLKAIIHGLFDAPAINAPLREKLEALSSTELHTQLQRVDVAAAQRIHPHDHKRLVRALEVYQQTGQPLSSMQQQFALPARTRPMPVLYVEVARETLYSRINKRVDAMMQAGWLDEVHRLLSLPQPLSREAAQAAGYRELIEHVQGGCTLEEAIQATKTRTRQLAKRQLTWFRHFPGLERLAPELVEKYLADRLK